MIRFHFDKIVFSVVASAIRSSMSVSTVSSVSKFTTKLPQTEGHVVMYVLVRRVSQKGKLSQTSFLLCCLGS